MSSCQRNCNIQFAFYNSICYSITSIGCLYVPHALCLQGDLACCKKYPPEQFFQVWKGKPSTCARWQDVNNMQTNLNQQMNTLLQNFDATSKDLLAQLSQLRKEMQAMTIEREKALAEGTDAMSKEIQEMNARIQDVIPSLLWWRRCTLEGHTSFSITSSLVSAWAGGKGFCSIAEDLLHIFLQHTPFISHTHFHWSSESLKGVIITINAITVELKIPFSTFFILPSLYILAVLKHPLCLNNCSLASPSMDLQVLRALYFPSL